MSFGDRQKIFIFQLRVVCKDLFLRCSPGKPLEDFLNRNAVATNTRLSESNVSADRYTRK